MYHIFVDLEMQEIEHKNKKLSNGLKNEIIEFGAVVFNEYFVEVDSFKSYVKPVYSARMRRKFIELTGITDSMIMGAKGFKEVLEEFCLWCTGYGAEIAIYEWNNNDLAQILREAKKKNVEITDSMQQVLSNWQDVQRQYGDAVDSNTHIALETAIWTFGECFKGRAHDAVNDARNTGLVYAMLQNEKDVDMAKQMLHHGTIEKVTTFTLGDLFDFSKLQLLVG